MLRLLSFLLNKGVVTKKHIPQTLRETQNGLPIITSVPCKPSCDDCIEACPTKAIDLVDGKIRLDRGACIACGECLAVCPTGTLKTDRATATFASRREELILTSSLISTAPETNQRSIFGNSLALRVVSTGCAACDLEISAACNPIFDIERFGVSVVASPRFADALLITGPVPKAMHESLRICYDSMASPKIVIACGTCAVSGGLHRGGYAEANGAAAILPVDLFIPGCPPHPWQIIQGILAAKKSKAQRLSRASPVVPN